MSTDRPVLSACILPNASSIMLSKSKDAGVEVQDEGVFASFIEGDKSKLSES